MKKLVTGLTAIAAVAGLTSAFAFAPKKYLAHVVYAGLVSGNYTYYSAPPTPNLACNSNQNTVCSFSSTATFGYFNAHFQSTFPQPLSSPVVDWSTNSTNQIYK